MAATKGRGGGLAGRRGTWRGRGKGASAGKGTDVARKRGKQGGSSLVGWYVAVGVGLAGEQCPFYLFELFQKDLN
jgi:hypothetical protein